MILEDSKNIHKIGNIEAKSDFARCLIPLLTNLGWNGDESYLFEALPHFAEELNLSELVNTMANLKFESKEIRTTFSKIDPRNMPCLFVPEDGAAKVIIKSIKDGGVLAFDGEMGTYSQIKKLGSNGTVYLFSKMGSENFSLLQRQKKWFLAVMLRFKSLIFQSFLISLLLSILAFISPLFVMTIYNQLFANGDISSVGFLGIGIFIYIIADLGFRFLRSHIFAFMSARMGNIVGNEVFRRILHLPSQYTEGASLGSQVARMKDFDSVRAFFGSSAVVALSEMPFTFLILGGMFALGGPVAFVPVAGMVLFVLFGLSVDRLVNEASANAAKTGTKRQEFLLEILSNFRAIKYTCSKGHWLDKYDTLSADAVISSYESSKLNSLINGFSQMFVSGAGIATIGFGVYRVMEGHMTTGALMACMLLVWRILSPLRTGFGVVTQLGKIKKSIAQMDRFMDMPLENNSETSVVAAKKLEGKIDFSQVSIRYSPEAHPALIGINFQVKKGETLVIIGHDGAGKTTVLKLIMGLYYAQAGRVILDSMNVRQMDPLKLRKSICYSPEANQFFYGTVAQNMRFANLPATDEDIHWAAEKAGLLDEILALEDGFGTRIGEHNLELFSTSFKKRLNLARCFLRRTSLMLLDEPEKGMEEQYQQKILESLSDKSEERTTVIVTKSVNYFDVADKVLWLDRGRVRLFGTATEVADKYRLYMSC